MSRSVPAHFQQVDHPETPQNVLGRRVHRVPIVTEEQTNPNVANSSITMYGTAWCQDCRRAKQFFGEHRVAYTFIDVDEDANGLRVVEKHNDGKHVIRTIVFGDGSVLVEPSNVALAAKLGL